MPLVTDELLVVSLTPPNLERGVLWFSENFEAIKKARLANPWWRNNSIIIEKDLRIKPSELSRIFLDLGYERSNSVHGRGILASRGGVLELWPVNHEKPFLIEFNGNYIAAIYPRPNVKEHTKPKAAFTTSLDNLIADSFVVHQDHGIGVFKGVVERNRGLRYYALEYAPPREGAEPDRLYVPFEHKERLTPYVGFELPKIQRLGGSLWEKSKRKVQEDAEKLARELLSLYAKRSLVERRPHLGDQVLEEELRRTFAYQETADQLQAEREIMQDLENIKPMDRVLCGDVGFGKTEIAVRAACRVLVSGRQVAVLSPTTVLAAQHEKTFQSRMENIPVNIKMLSRLISKQDEKEIVKKVASGEIDCVIGTHRLLSRDISFKNLGLVIIDEEQRFGVKQKEKLKELRAEADILSLSATPIPRTLQLTLTKLREISLIETPPPERVPIETLVLPYSLKTIHEAIRYELERDGQVYFLHNRIETMGHVKKKLERILAGIYKGEAVSHLIGVIHGRLSEKEILETMDKFRNKKIKILLATTIIENGLDISSANTLIVDEATRLGLAEAHQLRGRIGRSTRQALAYFLYRTRHLTEKSAERLEALQEYGELGAGYHIALRDLEIRGAGNILGREQSGSINKVGLNLYYQILNEAIEEERLRSR